MTELGNEPKIPGRKKHKTYLDSVAAELYPYNVPTKKRKFSWRKYGIYHLRWQSGFLLNFAIFYICIDLLHYPTWLTVIIFQFFGAIIYWYVDKYIFNKIGHK